MSSEPLIREVEAELLRLAKAAVRWEVVWWLAQVADCFDGGDFEIKDFASLRWRLQALRWQGVDADTLIDRCQAVLDSERTRERNDAIHCGNLRANTLPNAMAPPLTEPLTEAEEEAKRDQMLRPHVSHLPHVSAERHRDE